MTANNPHQKSTEDAISAARTAVVHIYDSGLPEAAVRGIGFDAHDAIEDDLRTAMNHLDEASDALQEFGFNWHDMGDEADELANEVATLTEQVDATEFGILAQSLLHELRGRMMTDTPERVVWWMEHALETVLSAPTPDDASDAGTLLAAATH